MKTSVNTRRWQIVQKLAFKEWTAREDLVEDEFKEAKRKYQKILKSLEKRYNLSDNYDILDIGCGPTLVGRLFPKGKLTGIDPMANQLGIAERHPNFKIINGRGEELPFDDGSFDVAFCRNVLDHVQSPKKVVAEAHRVLKRGGFFFLACYTYTPFVTALKNLAERLAIKRNLGHPFTFTPQSLRELINDDFRLRDEILIHEGKHPNDYGKVEPMTDWSPLFDLVLFINRRFFAHNWFVREILLVCQKES